MQNSGVFPLGHPGTVDLMESSGLYNQNQVISNVNAKLNPGLSQFGFYVFQPCAPATPTALERSRRTPTTSHGEYGDQARFRCAPSRPTIQAARSTCKWAVRISPFVVMQSGSPFDITAGDDPYGTTMFNARPGIATDPNKPGLIQTAYGLLDQSNSPASGCSRAISDMSPASTT